MPVLLWDPRSKDSPRWYYDVKRSTLHYQETTEERDARLRKELRAKVLKEERARWDEMRRRARQYEENKRVEKADTDKRSHQTKTRIDHLRKRIAANADDDAARAELAYARTQLFWENSF